jgi:hypothetical protein
MEKFENLKKWIIHNGGFVHPSLGIDLSCPENRIIIANEKILKDEVILQIPKKLTIRSDANIKVHKNFSFIQETIRMIPVLHKEFSLGEDSFYYPYLSMLNGLESYKTHPHYIFMKRPDFEKDWKRISNIISLLSTKTLKERIMNLYIQKNMNLNIDNDTVLYYHLLFMTRTWSEIGFVPFADLFQSTQSSNMALVPKLRKQEDDNNVFYELVIDRDYEANDVIYINYMIFDESLLYSNFGFIDDINETRNDNDRTIQIRPEKYKRVNDSEFEIFKEDVLKIFPMNKNYISTAGISKPLHQYLRILNLTEKDYQSINDKSLIIKDEMISLDNELSVLRSILNFLNSTSFPTEEMVSVSEKIVSDSTFETSSVEYNLAKLTLYQKKIFNTIYNQCLSLNECWSKMLNIPSSHHLIEMQ